VVIGENGRLLHELYDVFEDEQLDMPEDSEALATKRAKIAAKRAANPWYSPGAIEE
jgi:hypothetical protein